MNLKCLVAEEAAFIREIYRLNLQSLHSLEIVAEARDGADAIKLLADIKPDILIMEMVLSVKSGIEVLQSLAAVSPQTRVLVISSLQDEAIVAKAKALGAVTYLAKPFTRAQLLEAVDSVSRNYDEVQNG